MSIHAELAAAEPRPPDDGARDKKKNYAQRLSQHLATKVANGLRTDFRGILPHKDGSRQESRARTGRGLKKLDVNYSTVELGLGLGVTIKTISFPSARGRFTKNYTRADNELRAEANDYHQRQPWAVLVGLIYLPTASLADGKISSFGMAVKLFRYRANRANPSNQEDRLERIFIGVYEPQGERRGEDWYFDVLKNPPKRGRPVASDRLTFEQMIEETKRTYDLRNNPPFKWATESD
jgi:hypothetical protein